MNRIFYHCPMHPEVRQEGPGRCPKCGMELVAAGTGEGHVHSAEDIRIGSWRRFIPLAAVFSTILAFTAVRVILHGEWDMMFAMRNFMASFFLVFGLFKAVNLRGFADAYSTYDVIAKRSRFYALLYPFLELALGLAYLFSFQLLATSAVTALLMSVSAVGVARELARKNQIPCACLGVVFKIPMTKVTLLEDVLMAAMALWMIVLLG